MHAALLLALAAPSLQDGATPPLHTHPGAGPHAHAGEAGPRDDGWVYYDWLDGSGRLRGGRVRVDSADPLLGTHAPGAGVGTPTPDGTNVVTLLDNGPTLNRLDLVIVGDGYTAGQMGAYAAHVNAIWPVMLADHPFDDYQSYFNVHRVDVISNESGVDNDPFQGIQKDTALDMEFWCSGIERLLCVNVGKAGAQAAKAPGSDQVLAIANSTKYGGAGYSTADLATLSGNNFSSIEIALHELGHSLGDLADEYDYGGPTTYQGPEPAAKNVSIFNSGQMASQQTKWFAWLGEPNVNTFEGATYSKLGVYRPTSNSKMRNLDRPFEQINAEQLIFELYRVVDPIDDATPAGTYFDDAVLFVDPIDPVNHSLDVTWLLDGAPIGGATAETLDVSTLPLGPGLYTVTARVVDETNLVRDEALRDELMTEERSWSIAVPGDPQPPIVGTTSGGGWIADLPAVTIQGAFLDTATAVRIDGKPATIQSQTFDTLVAVPSAIDAPGWVDAEVEGPGGTATVAQAALIGPTLEATTTGPGGTLDATLELGKPFGANYAMAMAGGTYPAPLVVAPIYYGLELDLSAAFQVPDSGVMTGTANLSYPVPDVPTLAGATLHLQAYAAIWDIPLTQSFSTLASVTF
ncbi:MAG: M64 family metallopeptidase [Planctomycetota bacterium]